MRAQGGARRFHLVDALFAGARAVPAVWAGAWGVLIYLAAVTAAGALLRPEGAAGWVQTGAAVLGALAAWGAANRIVIFGQAARHQGLGPAGLQFRGAEIAMIAAAVLNLIFLAMIFALLALVALALFGMAELDVAAIQARDWAAVGPPWRLAVLALVGVIVLAVPVLLIVRLALFTQATVGRGQAVSLNTLGIGEGSFWRLLLLLILVFVPLAGLVVLAGRGPVAGGIAAALGAGLWLPFAAGAMGAAYRRLEYWTREGGVP